MRLRRQSPGFGELRTGRRRHHAAAGCGTSVSSHGRKVVLVDAHAHNPQLAQSLGLLPQIGWEETLSGDLPLEEVVIESIENGLAVVPICNLSSESVAEGQVAASFEILAREFEVVLVDLGSLAEAADEDAFWREAAGETEAVALVQNVRVTTPNQLAGVQERLAAAENVARRNHPELCRRVSHHVRFVLAA